MQNALAALKTLRQQSSSASDAGKAAAMQKLEALKAQLKNLMMLGGDPKQRAKEAAAIARQIAAAAQAYADAGGDPSTLAVPQAGAAPTPGATTPVATSAADAQAAGDPSVASAATPDPVAAASSPPQIAASADVPALGASAGGQSGAGVTASQSKTATGAAQSPAVAAAAPSAAAGSSEMDQAFVREARLLASQAKAIIQSAEQTLKRQHKSSDPAVAGAGDAAVAAVDTAANQIGAAETGGYDGAASASPAPAISITV